MKFKFLLFVFFIVLINLISVNADIVDVNFQKENYATKETLQAEINFNVDLLEKINVLDFELFDDGNNKIAIGSFLIKLTDKKYYIYFNLPDLANGNYTLKIKDITYIDSENILRKVAREFNFSIIDKDFVIQLDPAILKVNNPDDFPEFNIKISNFGQSTDILIETENNFIQLFDTFSSIDENEVKTFKVIIDSNNLDNVNKGSIKITYGNESYTIPVYLVTGEEIIETKIPRDAIRFIEETNIINKTLYIDESIEGSLKFQNFFNETISNLRFELTNNLDEVVDMELTEVSLNENETKEQYLVINKNRDATAKVYFGDLVLRNQDIIVLFPIYLNFKEREVVEEVKNDTKEENQTTDLFEPTEAEQQETEETKESKKTLIIVLIVVVVVLLALGIGAYSKRKKVIKQSFSEFASSFEKKK